MLLTRGNWIIRLVGVMRALGPYAAIELILPGGTLLACSLWAYRRRSWLAAHARRALGAVAGFAVGLAFRKRRRRPWKGQLWAARRSRIA